MTQKQTPQPRDKLDTSVNGPTGPRLAFDGDAWEQVDWRSCEEQVRRLRCRIFQAVKDGDLATARNLQRLAAVLVEHAGQRAAGHATQHGPQDRGSRRAGRVDQPGPGRGGGAGARHTKLVAAFPGPKGVYSESR
jgi:hypothetical protein